MLRVFDYTMLVGQLANNHIYFIIYFIYCNLYCYLGIYFFRRISKVNSLLCIIFLNFDFGVFRIYKSFNLSKYFMGK